MARLAFDSPAKMNELFQCSTKARRTFEDSIGSCRKHLFADFVVLHQVEHLSIPLDTHSVTFMGHFKGDTGYCAPLMDVTIFFAIIKLELHENTII